jgi:hypothetical protein
MSAHPPRDSDRDQKLSRPDRRSFLLATISTAASPGAIEDEIADELHINHAALDNWITLHSGTAPASAPESAVADREWNFHATM